jgi:hypothetical protein
LNPARKTSGKVRPTERRRALGHLLGNTVRFGKPADTLAAGKGVETMLALKSVLPLLPMAAGLSPRRGLTCGGAFCPPRRRLRTLATCSAGDLSRRIFHGAMPERAASRMRG